MTTTASNVDDIKWLRDETGAGIMDAKKALQEAGGDREKARKLLEQRGMASAEKRAGRDAAQGIVDAYIHHNGQIGVLVELDCETDFVARMPQFKDLAHEIALQIATTSPEYLSEADVPTAMIEDLKNEFRRDAVAEGKPEKIAAHIAEGRFRKWAQQHVLLEQPHVKEESKSIKHLVQELSAQTKENIVVRRFCRYRVGV